MTHSRLDTQKVSFHDVALVGMTRAGEVVTFALEGLLVDGVPKAVEVTVDGVSAVVRNGSPEPDLRMEKKAGEILTLREEDGHVRLAVQWDDFVAKTHQIVAYVLEGPQIALRAAVVR